MPPNCAPSSASTSIRPPTPSSSRSTRRARSRHSKKRGVFRSLTDLQAAIKRFVAETNNDPKPFVWNADPKKIIAAVTRGYLYRGLASLAPAMGPWQIHGMAIRENQRANYEQSLELRRGDAHGKLMILGRPTLQWEGALTPEEFYKGFGFDEVHTLDVSPYQGASHIHDLNKPLPAELAGQYDTVLSGGTLEHVFDVANALKCLAGLAKVGGTVICGAPTNNWIDHGFYQLSPTLKFDFFSANEFELRGSRGELVDPKDEVRRLFPLYPGEGHPWNGARRKLTHVLTAKRLPESTVDRIPIQNLYLDMHGDQRRKFRFQASEPHELKRGVFTSPPSDRFDLKEFRPLDGRWAAPFHDAKHPASVDRRPFRSKALVYEDGELLEWIVSDPTMVKDRPGSFYHAARFVHFSTSDGSDPRSSGKRYEVVFPDLSEWN